MAARKSQLRAATPVVADRTAPVADSPAGPGTPPGVQRRPLLLAVSLIAFALWSVLLLVLALAG